ncbi:MAG: C40 family peptidase [Eubacterium sp.]|nr:C40 family peptidase [Eubacterium sp.]
MNKGIALLAAVAVISIMTCGCGGTDNSSQNSYSSIEENSQILESKPESTSGTPETSVPQTTTAQTTAPQESEPQPGQSTEVPDTRAQIVETAQALIGIDFATGGASPETGFDNSGLIYYVLRENGYINCPRSTYDQKNMGTRINIDQLQPGDLVFFVDKDTDNEIGFGGIYIGDDQLIYSPYPGEKVKYADLTGSYWRTNFDCAVRVF